jgi:hypothetical protein
MANNGKGIGPNRLGASKGSISSPAKQKMETSEPTASPQKDILGESSGSSKPTPSPKGKASYKKEKERAQSLPKSKANNNVGFSKESSPAKKNGMKYDIKEASNQSLSASARKNYAENAQHDSKKGYR